MNYSQLAAIAGMYGLPVPDRAPEPLTGATSHVYPVGDGVIKVAPDKPGPARPVQVDAAMSPVARDPCVRTPGLIAFDDSGKILPVPFGIFWCRAQTCLHAASSYRDRGRLHTDMAALHAFARMQEWA